MARNDLTKRDCKLVKYAAYTSDIYILAIIQENVSWLMECNKKQQGVAWRPLKRDKKQNYHMAIISYNRHIGCDLFVDLGTYYLIDTESQY